MNYNTASARVGYGRPPSVYQPDGYDNSNNRYSQPQHFSHSSSYGHTNNHSMAPASGHNSRPLLISPSAFADSSQTTSYSSFRPESGNDYQGRGEDNYRGSINYQTSSRMSHRDYGSSSGYRNEEYCRRNEEYGRRGNRSTRRDDGGGGGREYLRSNHGGGREYPKRSERRIEGNRADSLAEPSSSWRNHKRPTDAREEDRNRQQSKTPRRESEDRRRSGSRTVATRSSTLAAESTVATRSVHVPSLPDHMPLVESEPASTMDQYGYVAAPHSGSHRSHSGSNYGGGVGSGNGRYFGSMAGPSDTSVLSRTFPSKNTVAAQSKRGRSARESHKDRRNKFNIGDTSDDDDYPTVDYPTLYKRYKRTPSRSPLPDGESAAEPTVPQPAPVKVPLFRPFPPDMPDSKPAVATLKPAAAHKPVVRDSRKPVAPANGARTSGRKPLLPDPKPAEAPVSLLQRTALSARPPPPQLDAAAAAAEEDDADRLLAQQGKISPTVVTISSDSEEVAPPQRDPKMEEEEREEGEVVEKAQPPQQARRPYVSQYSLFFGQRRSTVATRKRTVATPKDTVVVAPATAMEGEDEYEDTVATPPSDPVAAEEKDTVAEEEVESPLIQLHQPPDESTRLWNTTTWASSQHFDGEFDDGYDTQSRRESSYSSPDGRRNEVNGGYEHEELPYRGRGLNEEIVPDVQTDLHPGVQHSKLVIDLWTGEAVVQGQGGKETGFTKLTEISLTQRGGTISKLFFEKEPRPPAIYYESQSTTSHNVADPCYTNAIIDAVNGDYQRSKSFNKWGNVEDAELVDDDLNWEEKQKMMRREQREAWGEWEERKMSSEEGRNEHMRREQADRLSFEQWMEERNKKREEEQAKVLREMEALLQKAKELEAGKEKTEELKRKWKDERRAEFAWREEGDGEEREEEEELENPGIDVYGREGAGRRRRRNTGSMMTANPTEDVVDETGEGKGGKKTKRKISDNLVDDVNDEEENGGKKKKKGSSSGTPKKKK